MSQSIIAPSILAANFGILQQEIQACQAASADWLHIDVMDGSFVPVITFGDNMVKMAKSSCTLELDVHLMTDNSDTHIEACCRAGAHRITVHQESCRHLHRTLSHIRSLGLKSGVAINPATPVCNVLNVLEVADLVLLMTVNPGWGGQTFIDASLNKISKLKEEIIAHKLNTLIQVDGGINLVTAQKCRDAGADVLVAGSSIFGASQSDNLDQKILAYKKAIEDLKN